MLGEILSGAVSADSAENMGGLVFDRIPKPRVSAMENLYTGFNFVVSLNEFTYGFQSVSNIQRHREVRYQPEGGVNDHQIMVGAPNDNPYTLSLRRGYILHAPDDIINKLALAGVARIPNETARKLALIAVNATSPQAALENGPAPGFIQVYSRQKKLVAMFSFLSLGMTEWTFSNLDAQSNELLFEDITIAHTGLTLLPTTWMPSVAQPIMSLAGTNEDSMATMTEIIEKNKKDFEERQAKMKALEKRKKMIDDTILSLLRKRDEIIAEKERKEREKAKEEAEKAKEEQAKANEEALKARQEQAKKSEEAREEAEKAKEEQVKANEEALKERQEQQKADYERRMEAQKARTDKQNAQDKENLEKVEKSNAEAEERMSNEGEE